MKIAVRVLLLVALLAACGGGDGKKASSSSSSSKTSKGSSSTSASSAASDDSSLPAFISDFDRVCTTQVGFSGAAQYTQSGIHPMVFFEDFRGGDLVESSRTFPEGWVVKEDSNFSDNSELKRVQLVACSTRKDLKPTGKKCDFNSDSTNVTLELVDASYDLKVYNAVTGAKIFETTLEASTTDCPFIATFQAGDTTFVAEPEDDAYTNALKDIVES